MAVVHGYHFPENVTEIIQTNSGIVNPDHIVQVNFYRAGQSRRPQVHCHGCHQFSGCLLSALFQNTDGYFRQKYCKKGINPGRQRKEQNSYYLFSVLLGHVLQHTPQHLKKRHTGLIFFIRLFFFHFPSFSFLSARALPALASFHFLLRDYICRRAHTPD